MNKKLIAILFLTFSFFSKVDFVNGQDSDRVFLPKNTMLKKGNWALTFEVGTMFGTDNALFEAYNFTMKKHISDKAAIRLSFGYSLYDNAGNANEYNSFYNYEKRYDIEGKYIHIQTSVNIQYYLIVNHITKLFISAGPYVEYNYQKVLNQDSLKTENWSTGLFSSVGTELFIVNNLSLIGEYILKVKYGKETSESKTSGYNQYTDNKIFTITFNTVRIGVSIYF